MNVKQLAIQDIVEDLKHENKTFIAFRNELNPVIRKIVAKQIGLQNKISSPLFTKKPAQLIAHCFFMKSTGKSTLYNYSKYYEKK